MSIPQEVIDAIQQAHDSLDAAVLSDNALGQAQTAVVVAQAQADQQQAATTQAHKQAVADANDALLAVEKYLAMTPMPPAVQTPAPPARK